MSNGEQDNRERLKKLISVQYDTQNPHSPNLNEQKLLTHITVGFTSQLTCYQDVSFNCLEE